MSLPLAPVTVIVAIASAAAVVGGWQVLAADGGSRVRAPVRPIGVAVVSIDVGGVPTDVEATRTAVVVSTSLGDIVRVDPRTNEPVARIRTGGTIVALERGLGALWAIDISGGRLLRIDPTTNLIEREIPVDSLPSGLAIGHGLVWVASQLESTVAGIDPTSGEVLKLARFARGELWPGGLAVGPDGVWVITGAGNEVSLFDPATMTFRHRTRVPGARTLVSVGRAAWVGIASERTLLRIHDGRLLAAEIVLRADGYGPALASDELVWTAEGNALRALDPATGAIDRRLRLPGHGEVAALAVAGDAWAVDARRRVLLRIELGERSLSGRTRRAG